MEQSKQTYKNQGNISFFDNEENLEKLNELGNPLEKLSKTIDFEMFREDLERGFTSLYHLLRTCFQPHKIRTSQTIGYELNFITH